MTAIPTAAGTIGAVDDDRRTETAEFALGTTLIGNDGFAYVYVQANGAIAADQIDVSVNSAFQASDGLGTYQNSAAFADNEFGFVKSGVGVHTIG